MLKSNTVLALGLWIVAISLFGIAKDWKIFLYFLIGVILIFLFLLRLVREWIYTIARQSPRREDSFTENGGPDHISGAQTQK